MAKKKTYTDQGYLVAIARTKLLFCTDTELFMALNYSDKNKSIGRLGGSNPIMKKALLAYMDSVYAKAVSQDIDLISVLNDYIQATEYVSRFIRHKYFKIKNNKDNFVALIEHFCAGRTDFQDRQLTEDLEAMDKDGVGLHNYVLPIMLLILWRIIPVFHTNKVQEVKELKSDAERMFGIVDDSIKTSKTLRRFPIIDRCRKDFENSLKEGSPEIANRLRLIRSLFEILNVLHSNSSPERMIETFDTLELGSIDINGYWKDVKINKEYDESVPKEDRDRPTYWHFESEDGSIYNVRQVVMDHDEQPSIYRTYEVLMIDDEHALFISKEALGKIIENGRVPDDMQFIVTINKECKDGIVEMELTCCSDNKWFESRTMARQISTTESQKLFDRLTSCPRDIIYELVDFAYAITEEHVYFRKPDSDLFYKIPRLEHFENSDIYDLAMFQSDCLRFVGSPATLKYIDISDDDKLESKGVSIVEWNEKTLK